MPEQGRYKTLPRSESIQQFIKFLVENKTVVEVSQESDQIIHVRRVKYSSLSVFMTNSYIVSLADVHEILTQAAHVNTIVTMSAWNGYTKEAKQFCKERGIGLFRFKEFLGAVYYDKTQYLDYILPE